MPLTISSQCEHRYGRASPSDHVSAYGNQQEPTICSVLCVRWGTTIIPNATIVSGMSSAGLRRSMRPAEQTVRSKPARLCKLRWAIEWETSIPIRHRTCSSAKAESCTRRLVGEVTRMASATGGCRSASKNMHGATGVPFASDQGDIQTTSDDLSERSLVQTVRPHIPPLNFSGVHVL